MPKCLKGCSCQKHVAGLKIAAALTGRSRPEETRAKISASLRGRSSPLRARPLPDDVKERMSESQTERWAQRSEEARAAVALSGHETRAARAERLEQARAAVEARILNPKRKRNADSMKRGAAVLAELQSQTVTVRCAFCPFVVEDTAVEAQARFRVHTCLR